MPDGRALKAIITHRICGYSFGANQDDRKTDGVCNFRDNCAVYVVYDDVIGVFRGG